MLALFRRRRLQLPLAVSFLLLACGGPPQAEGPSDVALVSEESEAPPVIPAQPKVEKKKRATMNDAARSAFQAGVSAFGAGDLTQADAKFRAAIAADPMAHEAHFALGTALERAGAEDGAIVSYQNALSLVPDYEPAIVAITKLYLAQKRIAEAEAFLERKRSEVPASAAVLAALAEVKSVRRDSGAAQELARLALKSDPDYRVAMVVMARDHYRNRRLDLALYTLRAILDGYGPENPPRDKNSAEARLLRALIYKEQNNRGEAIAELERVVALRPDIVVARLNLAAFMLEVGNAAAAVPLLEGALAFQPANVYIHLNLGDAYRLQGRPQEALTQLQWVTQAAPKLAEPYYNIGLVYLFSTIEGMENAVAIRNAISSFETYLKMRPRSAAGAGDDANELLQRAKHKLVIIEAMSATGDDDEFD